MVEDYFRKLAKTAIDSGADMFYGHGAHKIYGAEVYKGKPIFYCLGNFAFDWPNQAANKDGAVVRVVLRDKKLALVSVCPSFQNSMNCSFFVGPKSGEGARIFGIMKSKTTGVTWNVLNSEAVLIENSATAAIRPCLQLNTPEGLRAAPKPQFDLKGSSCAAGVAALHPLLSRQSPGVYSLGIN